MRRSIFNGFAVAAGAVLLAALGVSAHGQISNVFGTSFRAGVHSDVASGARQSPEPSESPEPAESPEAKPTSEPTQQPKAQENDDSQGQNNDDQGDDNNDKGDNAGATGGSSGGDGGHGGD